MATRASRIPYWAWFGVAGLVALATVLYVVFQLFPSRFVLAPGLREQGLNFPTAAAVHEPPSSGELLRPPPAPAPSPEPSPGPSERLWAEVGPLLAEGRHREALPAFEAHLARFPDDHDARREYARTLAAAGRLPAAERAYARVAAATGDPADRLELARLRWRLGAREDALSLFAGLAAEPDAGREVRLERARLLASAGRHREAEAAYRELLAEAEDPDLRLQLARGLYWAGRPTEAWSEAERVPDGSAARPAAEELIAVLRRERPLPGARAPSVSVMERARAAAADGDLDRAAGLYRTAALLHPTREAPRRALAELLATRMDDPDGARRVLLAYRDRPGTRPSVDLRRRLARYHQWAGDEEAAAAVLEELAREGETSAGDLALLGDLHRWSGRLPEAEVRYRLALEAEPDLTAALAGLRALDAAADARVEEREPSGAGLETDVFSDSDDFLRWSVLGRTVLAAGRHRVTARAGVRTLEGPTAGGGLASSTGPVAGVTVSRWWRRATVRSWVGGGIERFDPTGVQPFASAGVELPETGLEVAYEHSGAHPVTLTYASFRQEAVADRVRVSLSRVLGDAAWDLWISGEAGSLRGGGVDNGRFVGQAAIDRRLAPGGPLRIGYATRLLTTAEAAPLAGTGLASYWAPRLEWSHGATLALEPPPGDGWSWRLMARPGAAVVAPHGADDTELVFHFTGEGGLAYRRNDAALRARLGYARSRLEGYESLTGTLELFLEF